MVLPALMLLVTPYFLIKLGAETYGQWILINSIIGSLGILNLGLGDAAIRFISKYKASDQVRTIKIANTTYSFYLLLSLVGLLVTYLYLILESNYPLFFNTGKNNFIDLLKLGVALFGIRLMEQIIFSIYKGFERFDLFSKTSIASKTILVLSNILIVYLGYSLNIILVFSILSSFVFLTVEFILLKKFLPGFSVFPQFDKEIFSEIMKFGLWSWVQSIIGILSYQLDKFLVAYFAGVAVLAYYSIGFTVATQIFNVFVATSNWVFPKVSRDNLGAKDLVILYRKLQFAMISVTSISIAVFFLVKAPILNAWLGDDIYSKALPYIDNYIIFILVTSLTINPSYFMLGTSNMKLLIVNSCFSVILTGVFMYIMFQYLGPIGFVYGRIISCVITTPILLFLFYKLVLDASYKYIALELLLPLFFSVLLFTQATVVSVIALGVVVIALFIYVMKTGLTLKET